MGRHNKTASQLQTLNDILNKHIGPENAIKLDTLRLEFGMSERHTRTFLARLGKEIGAPLQFDAKRNAWFYTDAFAFFDHFAMPCEELQQLRIALEMLTQQRDLVPRFGLLSKVLEKIQQGTSQVNTHKNRGRSIFFGPQPANAGARHLPFFMDAVDLGWKSRFTYRPIGREERAVEFCPYFLRIWEGRWYVGGQSLAPEELPFIRVYPLDRIVVPVQDGFAPKLPEPYDGARYWAHIYGINDPFGDKTVEMVVLRFDGVQRDFFLEAPFFPDFEVLEDAGSSVTVGFQLKLNIELVRKIASYGHEATVLAPPRLIGQMAVFFEKAAGAYRAHRS